MVTGKRLAALIGASAALACADPAPPSVLLVTLDTTRIDHLPDYGYPRDITPNLSALARQSVRFSHAWSTSSWTLPAHASLFTGRFPGSHGAHADPKGGLSLEDAVSDAMGRAAPVRALAGDQHTLAELLAERGYRTGAFVGGPWLRKPFGLLQGFEHADDDVDHVHGRRADALTDRDLAWLAALPGDLPYFLFVNYFDPHAPFDPPAGFDDLPRARDSYDPEPDSHALLRGEGSWSAEQRQVIVDRYDGEIRFMDHHLGRLLDAVAARAGGDRTLIVVTSDHGEAFGEGGRYYHTYWLSEEILRIPFYVRYPDRRGAGSIDERPIQLVDVLPLVAAELGLALPAGVEGVARGARERAFARLYPQRFGSIIARGRLGRGRRAVIEWPFKLVEVNREEGPAVPAGRQPAGSDRGPGCRDETRAAHGRGPARRRPEAPGATPAVDDETRKLLRDLGYSE